MTILAIDTSSAYLSLAVMKNGKIIARLHRKAAMAHSSLLIPMIDNILKKARFKLKDIDCFAISIGPGSFTGLRISVTTVKALAYSLKKKIVAVPTLDVITANVKNFTGIICPVLDARKNKVYACIYKSDGKNIKKISRYLLLPLDELKNKTVKYDKIYFLGDMLGDKNWHPKAENAARLALEDIKKRHFVRAEDLEPLYLYSKERTHLIRKYNFQEIIV